MEQIEQPTYSRILVHSYGAILLKKSPGIYGRSHGRLPTGLRLAGPILLGFETCSEHSPVLVSLAICDIVGEADYEDIR